MKYENVFRKVITDNKGIDVYPQLSIKINAEKKNCRKNRQFLYKILPQRNLILGF